MGLNQASTMIPGFIEGQRGLDPSLDVEPMSDSLVMHLGLMKGLLGIQVLSLPTDQV